MTTAIPKSIETFNLDANLNMVTNKEYKERLTNGVCDFMSRGVEDHSIEILAQHPTWDILVTFKNPPKLDIRTIMNIINKNKISTGFYDFASKSLILKLSDIAPVSVEERNSKIDSLLRTTAEEIPIKYVNEYSERLADASVELVREVSYNIIHSLNARTDPIVIFVKEIQEERFTVGYQNLSVINIRDAKTVLTENLRSKVSNVTFEDKELVIDFKTTEEPQRKKIKI